MRRMEGGIRKKEKEMKEMMETKEKKELTDEIKKMKEELKKKEDEMRKKEDEMRKQLWDDMRKHLQRVYSLTSIEHAIFAFRLPESFRKEMEGLTSRIIIFNALQFAYLMKNVQK